MDPNRHLGKLGRVTRLETGIFNLGVRSRLRQFVGSVHSPQSVGGRRGGQTLTTVFFVTGVPTRHRDVDVGRLAASRGQRLVGTVGRFHTIIDLFPEQLAVPGWPAGRVGNMGPPNVPLSGFEEVSCTWC